MKIIAYEDRYRDDLIFMFLEAKNAIAHLCRNEKVRKSELTREKQRLLWEV